jgi:hypothetical protein
MCKGQANMQTPIIAAVLHGFYSICAAVVVVLVAIALVKYRAYR